MRVGSDPRKKPSPYINCTYVAIHTYEYGIYTVSRARGIQYETVGAVANGLVAQGVKPGDISGMMIREETGTGSLTTILNHLRRWNAQFRSTAPEVTLTADSMTAITSAVAALIHEASERVRDEERKANAASAVESERVRVERDDALALNEQIEAEREAAVAEVAALRAEVDAGRLREAALQGKLDALGDTLARVERLAAGRQPAGEVAASAATEPKPAERDRREGPATKTVDQGQQLAAALVAAQARSPGSGDRGTEVSGTPA